MSGANWSTLREARDELGFSGDTRTFRRMLEAKQQERGVALLERTNGKHWRVHVQAVRAACPELIRGEVAEYSRELAMAIEVIKDEVSVEARGLVEGLLHTVERRIARIERHLFGTESTRINTN